MPQISAGLLMYHIIDGVLEIFLGHPGGPFYQNKDDGHWSIPKGLVDQDEDIELAAKREFEEETGIKVQAKDLIELGKVRYKNGKQLYVWAFEGEWEEKWGIQSNTFQLEWPPKSGNIREFPELDRAGWFHLTAARNKILPVQWPLVEHLMEKLGISQTD